ncbi:HEPN domain-containing protein [Francisella sp. LA112445]|uniref:HEPN domain-containing protein n=1 Tax=Francisella sp. LA112445 TaxID=1395624 RepID=UPI001788E696|nr:HEPN domain-containing protein [Francisella sp. LA112445]QIW09767.1 hypothetical protein FIP56_03340 [Francisella sp. LA112445]
MFKIHQSAEENFNTKVYSLIEKIKVIFSENLSRPTFKTDIKAIEISDEDVIGSIKESLCDYKGNTVGRFFVNKGVKYGLIDEDHRSLVDLAEKMQNLPTFRDKLSQNFIEEKIFSWLELAYINTQRSDFISYLIEEAKPLVKSHVIYIPIANMIVEEPFSLCEAIVCNITESFIDEMVKAHGSVGNSSQDKLIENFRTQYQGYAVVKIHLECEPDLANELSIIIAKKVVSFLSIYSGVLLVNDIKCISKIKGTENLEKLSIISCSESSWNKTDKVLDRASMKTWYISKSNIKEYMYIGLETLSMMSTKEKPTEFESLLLNACMLYSKATFTAEPLEKLVYILSSLESVLLKSENEPIQQNLTERFAIFVSKELTERKDIIKNLRAVYTLRSRYLHHGYKFKELSKDYIGLRSKLIWL